MCCCLWMEAGWSTTDRYSRCQPEHENNPFLPCAGLGQLSGEGPKCENLSLSE